MFYISFFKVLINSILIIGFFGCATTQYIPDSNSNKSENNLVKIIVSKSENTELYSVDNIKISSRIILIRPGKHEMYFNLPKENPLPERYVKYKHNSDGSVTVIKGDQIGYEKYLKNPVKLNKTFEKGNVYGFKFGNFETLSSSSPIQTHEWKGFTLGLIGGGITIALIEGVRSSKEQDDMMKKTGDTNYKLPYNYGTVIAGTLISAASGYLLGLLWKTIEY